MAPYHKRLGMYYYTPKNINEAFIGEWRSQSAKGRTPDGDMLYLDEEVETTNGNKVSMLEMLTAESGSLQTQPEEIDEGITQEKREQLEALLGETGLKIFEYRHRHQEIIGQRGEKKIIAQALGMAESTVGGYIGTKNRIGIFVEKADKIREILS